MRAAGREPLPLQRMMMSMIYGIPGIRPGGGVYAVRAGMGAGKTSGIADLVAVCLELPGVTTWVVMKNTGQIDRNILPEVRAVCGDDIDSGRLKARNWTRPGVKYLSNPSTGAQVVFLYYDPTKGGPEAGTSIEGGNPDIVLCDEVQMMPPMLLDHATDRARTTIHLGAMTMDPVVILCGRPADNTWHDAAVRDLRRRLADGRGEPEGSTDAIPPRKGQLAQAWALWDGHLRPYWRRAYATARRRNALRRSSLNARPTPRQVEAAMGDLYPEAGADFAEAHPEAFRVLLCPDGVVTASAHDNPALSPAWFATKRATMPPDEYLAKIDGIGIPKPRDSLHPEWDIINPWPLGNRIEGYVYDPAAPLWLALDAGENQPHGLLFQPHTAEMQVCDGCLVPDGLDHIDGCPGGEVRPMRIELDVVIGDYAPDGVKVWTLAASMLDRPWPTYGRTYGGVWPRDMQASAPPGALLLDGIVTGQDAGHGHMSAQRTIAECLEAPPVPTDGLMPGLGVRPVVLSGPNSLDLDRRLLSIKWRIVNGYGHRSLVITDEALADGGTRARNLHHSLTQMTDARLREAKGRRRSQGDRVSHGWDAASFYEVKFHRYRHDIDRGGEAPGGRIAPRSRRERAPGTKRRR